MYIHYELFASIQVASQSRLTRAMKCLVFIVLGALAAVDTDQAGVAPWAPMNDGRRVPTIGLGTWLGFTSKGGRAEPSGHEVEDAVEWAIDAGYRHIDTARVYNTEEQVGRGIDKKIVDGTIKREDLFITTKLWNDKHAKDAVVPALQQSLKTLGLDYVDLYLIHWPVGTFKNGSFDNTDYVDTWQGMIEARNQGLTHSIGVSNFNQAMLERLSTMSNVKPAMLQVELNLNLQQPALLHYCRTNNIKVTAYTPFGSLFPSKAKPSAPPPRVDDPALVAIAQKHNKTTAQIALRYLVDLGVVPIPKSVTKDRIEQNIQLFDFTLTPEDQATLKQFDRGYRTIDANFWRESPYYPFERN